MRPVLGLTSGIFWVLTVCFAAGLSKDSTRLQSIYAGQAETAEAKIALLQPKIIAQQAKIARTSRAEVDLKLQLQSLQGNEDEIRDLKVLVTFETASGRRGPFSEELTSPFIVEDLGPRINCKSLSIPLRPVERDITPIAGTNSHLVTVTYFVSRPEDIEGKRIEVLNTCRSLTIPIVLLGVEDRGRGDKDYYPIQWLDAQFVVNGFPLNPWRLKTNIHDWMRFFDGAYPRVGWSINVKSPLVSQRYFHRHSKRSD